MMFEDQAVRSEFTESDAHQGHVADWGVSSETGLLREVLLSGPRHIAMIPCNEVARSRLAQGHSVCSAEAARQHRQFAALLERSGVRCRFVPARGGMADLCFTRDPVAMTPWGAVGLRPALQHRREETDHVLATLRAFGVPIAGRVESGRVEGGDVCLLRDGLALIAVSGDRTDETGARGLAATFEHRGWSVRYTSLDPKYLHLDTVLTMLTEDCAVACTAALEPELLTELGRLGIELIEASLDDVTSLAANLLSLGGRRVVAARGSASLKQALAKRGFDVLELDLDEFAKCGGGPHCLTMPLLRMG